MEQIKKFNLVLEHREDGVKNNKQKESKKNSANRNYKEKIFGFSSVKSRKN